MKFIVDGDYYPMEFNEEEFTTAASMAELLCKQGRKITLEFIPEEEEKEEEVCCPDCKCYKAYTNESGRLVQICEAHDIQVSGDFYCAWGKLNRIEK